MDTWNPVQYEKFRAEREQPFFDLLDLVRREPSMNVIDLGCGTGRQTRVLHERLAAAATVGLDRSTRMLEAAPRDVPGLSFREGAIEDVAAPGGPAASQDRKTTASADRSATASTERLFDLVFSNAALHWVVDHRALIPRLARLLNPAGQLAFQVPASHGDVSHAVAQELTGVEPFREALRGWTRPQPVLTPPEYAQLLFDNGFVEQHVRLVVYPHVLESAAAVVEWMKGTLLTEYQRHLPEPLRERFVDAYRAALLVRLGDARPFFFPFQRILCWGRLPG